MLFNLHIYKYLRFFYVFVFSENIYNTEMQQFFAANDLHGLRFE